MFSGVQDPSRWSFPLVIAEQAQRHGDRTFATMIGGESLTYREFHDDGRRVAGMLAALGIRAGDRVAILLPNGLDFIRAWAGIGLLGATAVPLNIELTGRFLEHPLVDAGPRVLIAPAALLAQLEEHPQALEAIERLVILGEAPSEQTSISFDTWRFSAPWDGPAPGAGDVACIMYTSGTTGPPKGVLMPHAHCFLFGYGVVDKVGVRSCDHYYVCLPLFHANGLLMQIGGALIAGASVTIRERFSASAWLADLQSSGATVTHTLGAMNAFLLAQPRTEADRDHHLHTLLSAPNTVEFNHVWRERFGIGRVIGGYGMTEANICLYDDVANPRPGTCGQPYSPFFEVEIRNPATDAPSAPRQTGEIMVRPRVAQAFMAGYNNLPDETVRAWRNLWFHTGDAGWTDEAGFVTFVDRIKDCIRRRGENISASDVEAVMSELPGIAEVAAYAVPSDIPGGEDEIMLAVVLEPHARPSPADIADHARQRMPRFAQPRYVHFLAVLPKTETEKIKKAELRQLGVTATTFDLGNR